MGKYRPRSKSRTRDLNTDEVHTRSRYADHSQRFLAWVDGLGFEQTLLGRLVQRLDHQYAMRRLLFVFGFSLILSYLVYYDLEFDYQVSVGEVAANDIKSPIPFQFIDEIETEEKRKVAELGVPPVFDYDPDVYELVLNRVYKAFRTMRREVRAVQWPQDDSRREETVKDFMQFKSMFEKELGREVPDRLFEWLVEKQFAARIENVVIRTLVKWSSKKIVDGQSSMFAEPTSPLLVRVLLNDGPGEEFTLTREDLRDIKRSSEFDLEGVRGIEGLSMRDKQNAYNLSISLVLPNLNFNRTETQARQSKAREAVLPVQLSIAKNQVIVGAGTVIQPIHVTLVNEINNLKSGRRAGFVSLVAALLFVVLVIVFFSYLRRVSKDQVQVEMRDLVVMGMVTVMVVGITKLFLFVTDAAFLSKLGPVIPAQVFLYSAPVAAGPMLIGLLISAGEIVWLFTIFLAITLAVMVDFNFSYMLVAAISGIAAARGVHSCKKRNDIYLAGIRTGAISAFVILVVTLLQKSGDPDLFKYLSWYVGSGFVGGVLASMVTLALVPLLESLFNYTTDVKLLELSSLNHPLMKNMIVKAPGTYHHSLIVGSMVEAGAEEIGANALLAKVMAYYHDIGKMEHSQYFIENQRAGHNPHDHISPNMSKTILIAHVKDGAEMGLDYKLGRPIIDGILQHHGTTLISYFYNKALEGQDEEIDTTHEEDFRYPGPKPQFKEAGLLMLADSIEAAARSLEEPTPGRLTSLVKNIIQSKFLDGQLDECDLTLKDLSVIEECYRRVLLGIYHQRIDYPTRPQPPQLPPALPAARSVTSQKLFTTRKSTT